MSTTATSLIIAWAVLAFGSVYPWAYYPLIAGLSVIGVGGLVARTNSPKRQGPALLFALLLLILVVVAQLVPLSRASILDISPAADSFLQRYDIAYMSAVVAASPLRHSLSINPAATTASLLQLIALAVFFLGLNRGLDGGKLRALLPQLVILGVLVATIGIVQKSIGADRIYGFWTPVGGPIVYSPGGGPFGPFVNRNHFAGWMLMMVPLTIGYFIGLMANGMRDARLGWRDRVLWFSSTESNKAALVGFAIIVMATSLVLTLSRSGILCFVSALLISALAIARNDAHWLKRTAMLIFLVAIGIASFTAVGVEPIVGRFGLANESLEGRVYAWQDAWRIFRAFPIVGTGLNTYGTATIFFQTFQTDLFHFAEAHNDYLQLLAEGGFVMLFATVLVVAIFANAVVKRLRERLDDMMGRWLRIGAITGLLAVLLQEVVDFSLQIPANAVLFSLLCSIAVRQSSGRRWPAPQSIAIPRDLGIGVE